MGNSLGPGSRGIGIVRRLPDWRRRLERLIDGIERDAFAYGAADCGPGWAGAAVEAVLGVDIAAPYRGRYSTAIGALRVMQGAGFDNLGDMFGALLAAAAGGPCEIHPSAARLGDVMAIPDEGAFGFSLGICNGERILVRRLDGKGTVDRLAATMAWRLGDA